MFVLLPAVVGAVVGFFALAFAVQNEPSLSPVLVSVFSPGLKVAELFTPIRRQSLGSTFGGFLRWAIAINALFYYVIFVFITGITTRLARPKSD